MALGLTQPLTAMSISNISLVGKGARRVGLTTLPPSYAKYLETFDSLDILEPEGLSSMRDNLGSRNR
jgi:hypothetical protein